MKRVKNKLKRMRALMTGNSAYSVQTENPKYLPIPISKLQKFEERHQMKLPKAYRNYLLKISNGGPGPGNGVFPLEIACQYSTNLHLPWINPMIYNKLFKYDHSKEEESFDKRMNSILNGAESPELNLYNARGNGILYLSDGGCGTIIFLVLNGTKRGQIWIDLNVAEEGFAFVADNFLCWYEKWLDKRIEDLEQKRMLK